MNSFFALNNPDLLKQQPMINGSWLACEKNFIVENPAHNTEIAEVGDTELLQVEAAIDAAHKSLPSWRATTAHQRRQLLKSWHQLILDNVDDLALLITKEQGKPLAEAKGEILYGASMVEYYAEEAIRIGGELVEASAVNRRNMIKHSPVGVVAAITPWNFPCAMITRKLAPALAGGCTIVLKPAAETPLTALALAELAMQAGFPDGVINVVPTTRAEEAGQLFCASPLVNKLTFTGSTRVGKLLYQQCASTVKRLSLELGGNAPFIVFDDADIDDAVEGLIASKFRNAGQTCVCANRVLIHSQIANEFKAKLIERVSRLSIGDGKSSVDLGPLIHAQAQQNVLAIVERAIEQGAKPCALINKADERQLEKGNFVAPVVLESVTADMDIFHQEIFGPVIPLIEFETEEEALALANRSVHGLAAYFYANDLSRVWRVSESLEYGIVGVNAGVVSAVEVPFGGFKESGLGRESGREGIDAYLETKSISMVMKG